MEFPDLDYVSLEPLDTREFAARDPRGFLATYAKGAIIDEVQNAPGLLSYLQEEVDEDPCPGRFVLTGSQHFGLAQAISQSLAGRCGVLHLLPPSLGELRRFGDIPDRLSEVLITGSYPRIHDRGIAADRWLADYTATYVERDVRSITAVGDLTTFTTFLRLAAGSTAQELNLARLGSDVGVSGHTIRQWLSILETSFLVTRFPSWHGNLRKRLVKRPKLHFLDSGLACSLLGITRPEQLEHHPLRGAIFESWVAAEIYKARVHAGLVPALHHLRAISSIEVDLILERGAEVSLIEVKAGATVAASFLSKLNRARAAVETAEGWREAVCYLVHGGEADRTQSGVRLVPWNTLDGVDWRDR